jgi:hypothetical protein
VITSTAGPGGFISPAGAVTVREGSDATFQISANGGYLTDDVKVNGASVGAVGTYTFANVRSNQTIAATFKEKPGVFYTLSAKTTTSGGTISPSGDVKVKEGSNQTFLIAASQGFSIRDVAVDGQSIGAQGAYTFEKVQAEGHRIEAAFQAIPKPKYVIAASAGNGGTVTPGGNVSVEEGSNAGFAIAASSGFKIADVKVDGVSVGALSTYTFGSVTANHSLAASFSQVPAPPPGSYKITVTVTGPGRAEPSGDVFVENGKSQTILFIPNAGGTVKNVVVDGVNLGPAVSYSFVGVNATHTLSVSF